MLREFAIVVTILLASRTLAAPCPATLITADTTIGADDAQFDGTALTVRGATVTIAGHHAFCRLVLDDGAVLTHAAADTQGIDLAVQGSVVVEAGSRLDVRGKGWPSRTGPGRPVLGTNGGAGHGGRGGAATSGAPGGACYGDLMAPLTPGSGGGGATGGVGGGVIRLVVDDTLAIGGLLDAGGNDAGLASHTGGSGGSVFVTAGLVTGNGTIAADGGGTLGLGGGGGGGRIAVAADVTSYTGTLSARGGAGGQRGGAGTIFTGDLRVANAGLPPGARTDLLDVERIEGNVLVTDGAVLDGLGNLVVTGDVVIAASGAVSADGGGYPHEEGPGASTLDGGGGHGGRGGAGVQDTFGGTTYDSRFFPDEPGSGGGGPTGGTGGGQIRLTVHGTLTIDGNFSANGGHGGLTTHGGGAGGAIRLTVASLDGSGVISASGGGSANAGGGGGGRIAIYAGECYANFDVQTQVLVGGGSGLNSGESGTTFFGHDNLLVAGNGDGFAPPSELAYQSAELQAALAGLALAPLDTDPAGGAVAVSFPGIAPQIATGLVALRLRAGAAPASELDRLVLGFADAGGLDEVWSRYLGSTSGTTDPGLVGRPWVAGADTTLVLDLSALPLADGGTLDLTGELAARGGLDLVVRHHTAVDFVLLTYCLSTGEPIGVVEGDGVPAPVVPTLRVAPNPFNPRAVVHFALTRRAEVTVAVYDLRGRRVASLVEGILAAGEHQVGLTANDLPSGTYFVRLDTGAAVVTSKVLLVR